MNFITLDFETATSAMDSPCEIGLTFVREGAVMETKSWLIKPRYNQFSSFNIQVHGIQPTDVMHAPEFDQVWQEISPLLENQFIIAHNARFDMNVLMGTLESYRLPLPTLHYSCSYLFSRKIWKGLPSYNLKALCDMNQIRFKHHRAGADSRATAELVLKAFERAGVHSMHDFQAKLNMSLGHFTPKGHKGTKSARITKTLPDIVADAGRMNPKSIFFAKSVVFTGTLTSMARTKAQQAIADIGGIISDKVVSDTDFLILGQQQRSLFGDFTPDSKQIKAMQLIEKGAKLEIMLEADFLRNL